MGFKINLDAVTKLQKTPTPSSSYYQAAQRFQTILSEHLMVDSTRRTSTMTPSPMVSLNGGIDYSDLTKRSGATASAIDARLAGTEMAGLGEAFVAAEQKYKVNAWFLAGLGAHESGYGSSRIAQSKQNLFGFMAYDATPYSSAKTYATFEESIDDVADFLSKQYLKDTGKYYNGTSIDAVNVKYATDPNWSNAIQGHIDKWLKES
jgi:beta-N-acetylglucosaminidase